MWGLYGLVYTAIGVGHAMHGPRRKWRPRILLLTAALGLTAAAHVLAAMVGFVVCVGFMFYVAERRRSAVLLIVTWAAIGALGIELAFFGFRPGPFSYVFTGGAGRFWFGVDGVMRYVHDQTNWATLAAVVLAVVMYAGVRRSRYFGNTTPLLMVLLVAFLQTTQVQTAAWVWALPFLFTFVGGVFADLLETKRRGLYLATAGLVVGAQALVCLQVLTGLGEAVGADLRTEAGDE